MVISGCIGKSILGQSGQSGPFSQIHPRISGLKVSEIVLLLDKEIDNNNRKMETCLVTTENVYTQMQLKNRYIRIKT